MALNGIVHGSTAGQRRIGVLMSLAPDDKESQVRLAAFVRALQELGWTADQNLRFDLRWGGDEPEALGRLAAELIALGPDVILASGSAAASPLHKASASIPIVFVQVAEPLGGRLVESFARPGANITGFASIEYGMSAKWLGLLKEIVPGVARAVVVRDPDSHAGKAQFGAIQSAARSLGVELSPVGVRNADEIERAIEAVAREPNGAPPCNHEHSGIGSSRADPHASGTAPAPCGLSIPLLRQQRRPHLLRSRLDRPVPAGGRLRRPHSQRCEAL
jgi:putative ABC transport system substrate-binding protein